MRTPRRIRTQFAGNTTTLGERFRDAQGALDAIPIMVLRKREMVYDEPLVLGGMERQPESIEAMRIIDLSDQEQPVHGGGLCHFVWRPNLGGAQITSVDGMSVAANGGKKYRFTFRLTFVPAGGFNG